MNCVEIDGYYKMIDPESIETTFDVLLLLVIEKSWSLDKIPYDECIEILEQNNDKVVLKYIFDVYGKTNGNDRSLDYDKLSLFRASQLFKTSDNKKVR